MKTIIFNGQELTRSETNWFVFKSNGYSISAKVYDEPSSYGIDGGRISKLEIVDNLYPRRFFGWEGVRLNYDRGWDIELDPDETPKYHNVKKLYNEILEAFN